MAEFGVPLLDEAGLRESSNPVLGVVRVVVSDGGYSLVLDDQNSDYREVELRAYRRGGQGCREIFSQDDAGIPDVGNTHRGGWVASLPNGGGYGWTFGRETPGTVVRLEFRGESVVVAADADGWWLCRRETADQQFDVPFPVG